MNITLQVPMDTGIYMDVEAVLLFDIAPHLAHVATFAVHRDPMWDRWNVTNVETGLYVTRDEHRAGAIQKARERLAKATPRKLLSAYRKSVNSCAIYGIDPTS